VVPGRSGARPGWASGQTRARAPDPEQKAMARRGGASTGRAGASCPLVAEPSRGMANAWHGQGNAALCDSYVDRLCGTLGMKRGARRRRANRNAFFDRLVKGWGGSP